MKKWPFVALLLVGATILGATVLREPIGYAASPFTNVIVGNDATNPVPVKQQGTANVNVTNSGIPVTPQAPISGGGQSFQAEGGHTAMLAATETASALMVTLTANAHEVDLTDGGEIVARFIGPSSVVGNRSYQLALSRPVSFDEIHCIGPDTETCGVSWIGNEP